MLAYVMQMCAGFGLCCDTLPCAALLHRARSCNCMLCTPSSACAVWTE